MLQLSKTVYGWRQRGWLWTHLQRGRRRWVHIDYPPRHRSVAIKVDDIYDKLMFVCNGYTDQLDIKKLPPNLQTELTKLKTQTVPINDRKLEWSSQLQKAITRKHTPCLAFVTGRSHHLIEVFTMEEILAFEKLIPEIRAAFKKLECEKSNFEEQDKMAKHIALNLD